MSIPGSVWPSMWVARYAHPMSLNAWGASLVQRGVPEHLRSDNGPEFTARAVRLWLQGVGATTLFITPGSPWENGYVESFNGKLRDGTLEP